ncbi:MAG: hypothetical protein ABIV94_06215 [Acidimicrobiales bacterium]
MSNRTTITINKMVSMSGCYPAWRARNRRVGRSEQGTTQPTRQDGRVDQQEHDPPDSAFDGLRRLALTWVSEGLGTPSLQHPDVSGVVVDVPADGGFAMVVALADDTTSQYTSTGGGTIGAGTHPVVARANRRLLIAAQVHLGLITSPDDGSLPPAGAVRLHVLTHTGARCADVPEDAFWGGSPHALSPLIAAVQSVVSAIREHAPS